MNRKSVRPMDAAATPVKKPAPTSQADIKAQKGSRVPKYARSLASAPTRNAIGNGTSIGCTGCPPNVTWLRKPGVYGAMGQPSSAELLSGKNGLFRNEFRRPRYGGLEVDGGRIGVFSTRAQPLAAILGKLVIPTAR